MAQKLKVGLDLDGVVYKFVEEFDKFAINRGYEIDESDYNRGIPPLDLSRLLKDFSRTKPFNWIPLYDGVKEDLDLLSNKMDFYIITHRDWYPRGKIHTIKRLAFDKIPFKRIYFSEDKAKFSRDLGLEYFIEDNLKNTLRIMSSTSTKPILIDRPYNKGLEKGLLRVKTMGELLWL